MNEGELKQSLSWAIGVLKIRQMNPLQKAYLGVIKDFTHGLSIQSPKDETNIPEIVCLCGSTRFYDEFQQANYDLTMQGKIVLSVGFYPHSKTEAGGHGEGVGHDSTEKIALDELHKRKIDLADRVFVLNVGGYIGDSTRSEINYAIDHGKPVDYLEEVA